MRRLTAAILIALAVLGGIAFRELVVKPAYTPLPDGNYSEIFGPVSFFRIPVYIACAALVLLGFTIAFRRPHK